MDYTERFVTADDGTHLYCVIAGKGPQTTLAPNGIPIVEDFAPRLAGRTLVFYDVRNRGRSDAVTDREVLERGIENDVDDIDAVRRQYQSTSVELIAHSYVAVAAVLYAVRKPDCVSRVVLLGPPPPEPATTYPSNLTFDDGTLGDVFGALASLEKERAVLTAEEFCRRFWMVLRRIYVTDSADAGRIRWGRCDLANERGARRYWIEHLMPSLQRAVLTRDVLAHARVPVLVIHGTKDRSAPYGAGRDWALRLPDARLVTVEGAGHAPWIESPGLVFESIETFLGGRWPTRSEKVTTL